MVIIPGEMEYLHNILPVVHVLQSSKKAKYSSPEPRCIFQADWGPGVLEVLLEGTFIRVLEDDTMCLSQCERAVKSNDIRRLCVSDSEFFKGSDLIVPCLLGFSATICL